MGQTVVTGQIVPELFQNAVQGAFASKNAFMGSLAMRLGIVTVNDSFPQILSNPESIGQTVSIPYFSSLGEFQDNVSDGTAATTVAMTQTKESATVVRGTLAFEISRWARGGAVPGINGRDIYDEAATQIMASAERYMDKLLITAATSGNNQLVLDKYSPTSPRNLDYDLLSDALGLWADFGDLTEVAAIAVHSKTYIDMLKMKDAVGRPLLVQPNQADAPPMFWGKPLIVSDKLPVDNSSLSAVVAAGTTPPTITVSGSTNRAGGTGPVRPVNLVVACTTSGARGTWKFKISIDGGATYTAADLYTSAATVALNDPLDQSGGLLGITLTIATGNAATDNTWTVQTILKHTSLLLKRGALVFWYARFALGLQTIPVPQADTIIGATHLYGTGYRYQRMPGQPYPGVVKIRHNAGGL